MESQNICRSCLKSTPNFRNIFTSEEILGQPVQLSDILGSCFAISITKDDGYPENICLKCFQLAKLSYLFRKLCEKSDATLREYLHANFFSADSRHYYVQSTSSERCRINAGGNSRNGPSDPHCSGLCTRRN
ncbi:unnamed protein product [Acanthoscelides obtectus]|uniref:ZAD domain-containing protein n=1 Tax=Acanthoscelides obtectus TaxID=200917 RepID=A0A9P0Q9F6_ACAOB|nr:unnamed protein product [Acanthoscelides obtectus]CAH2014229.1 unnamed protein product [Acanthoscelides obtectus]CAK1634558.1 hypothetical protein AOBTE_LOCUS8807 [Acanthoscelides obtectus]CAK1683871.1 hypothetical protein AOBTE_LOCUS34493 [Acanthoscelides obtectus]